MKKYGLVIQLLTLLFWVEFFIGCSRLPPKPADLPELYSAKVTVTFGGKAIEGVNVSLRPTDKNIKWQASGYTDNNGIANLRTSFAFPGVPVGNFIISFDKKSSEASAENKSVVTSEIPLKYSIGRSLETIEIKPEKNIFTFNLDAGTETITVDEPNNTGRMPKAVK
ncbi:MAG: hypothetical protein LBJ00_03525 [Planctomycetaceae bacterium]|jgi:hypothetical protein|nr:hypothetical protein [Planctomycetaceae bacterium]